MILNKSLLLKCLGGVAACFGTAGVGILGSQSGLLDNQPSGKETEDSQANNLQTESIVKKAGLNCGDENSTTGSNCTKKGGHENISVKKEENGETFNISNITTGKIKLYKLTDTTTYNEGFKLVIEEGDIAGTTASDKLEQFETYEIKEESGNYILLRKTKAAEGIRKELGLPDTCTLPETTSAPSSTPTCTINTTDIKKVKFEGVSDGQTVTSTGEVTLTITKLSSSDSDFPFGYKFSFKGKSADATLNLGNSNTITLKQSEGTEFGIKKGEQGNSISLKEVGTLKDLLEKVGLNGCTTSGTTECGIDSKGLNVKQESNSQENKKKSSSSAAGKIKVYTESGSPTYDKGFKFVIEEADISFEGSGSITKLEQFETYEIKKDESSNKWYLTRKTKAADGIKKELGLPEDCDLSTNDGCTNKEVSSESIKNINFDGKTQGQNVTLNGSTKLTVTKEDTSDPDFPYGYKFTFKADSSDATINITSSKSVTVKTDKGTEFRIKKGASGNSITLEEAWSLNRLLEKVGLNGCTTENSTECSISNGGLKVKQEGESGEEGKTKQSDSSGKIKVYKENTTTDYNHGFKFVIEEGDITFEGSGSITKLEQFETYEIKKESDKWYLTRKSKAAEGIRKELGLPDSDCNLPTDESTPTTCSNLDGEKLKKIKFDGKGNDQPSIESNGSATLTITKTSDTTTFPLGYKFAFDPTETVTISATNKIAKGSKTEFKIKKGESGNTITLEKAWTAKSLGEKVGLECKEPSDSDKSCTLKDDSINVNNGGDSKIDGAKEKSGQGSSKKVTYQEDAEGHNQGIKFTVDGSDCIELTKNGDDTKTLNIENSSNSYEIKEDTGDNKWYLTKYTPPASK